MKNSIMQQGHLHFFSSVINDSPIWHQSELKGNSLQNYLKKYENFPGEWRIWSDGEKLVGVTYTVQNAPSNNKPWIGTILISKQFRNMGYARRIIEALSDEYTALGYEALFTSVPIDIIEWATFLSKCQFEQYKIEKDNEGFNYLLLVRPLFQNEMREEGI